jgi:hypothetical protein
LASTAAGGTARVMREGVDRRNVAEAGTAGAVDTRGGSARAVATRDGVTGVVTGGRATDPVAAGGCALDAVLDEGVAGRCSNGDGTAGVGGRYTTGGGTTFGAPVCALGGAGAGAAGDVVTGRDGPLDMEDARGVFEPGSDVTDGVSGGGGVRCAMVRGGTTAPGADGASRKMTSERPTNPSATAATPYTINVFTEDPALPPGERG